MMPTWVDLAHQVEWVALVLIGAFCLGSICALVSFLARATLSRLHGPADEELDRAGLNIVVNLQAFKNGGQR